MPDNGPEDPQTLVRDLPLKWYAGQSYAHCFCQKRLRENGNRYPSNLNRRIRIPFRLSFAAALFSGVKTATSRTKRYGIPGDTFIVSGRKFVLTSVRLKKLRQVAHELWEEEGCRRSRNHNIRMNTISLMHADFTFCLHDLILPDSWFGHSKLRFFA